MSRRKNLNKGTFIKAYIAFCFECGNASPAFFDRDKKNAFTSEDARKFLNMYKVNQIEWADTPKGWWCPACQDKWASEAIEAVDNMFPWRREEEENGKNVVDADQGGHYGRIGE